MQISEDDFTFYKQFLDKSSGYNLYKDKLYFLENRLKEVMKCSKIDDMSSIRHALQREPFGEMAQNVIEAMTVNETFFFRDETPYTFFEETLLPELADQGGGRPLRIWSAACSTGQEPYSIAMILQEKSRQYPQLKWEITATDINSRILARARSGVFTELEISRGLKEELRDKYFTREGPYWKIDSRLREKIHFKVHNLREIPRMEQPYDFVLLRNVLIDQRASRPQYGRGKRL